MHILSSKQQGAKFVSVCVSKSVIIFTFQRGTYISISLLCNQCLCLKLDAVIVYFCSFVYLGLIFNFPFL